MTESRTRAFSPSPFRNTPARHDGKLVRAGAEMRWIRDDVRRAQTASMVRLIAERLQVKEMGPADHIRTKHEIKALLESGNVNAATELL